MGKAATKAKNKYNDENYERISLVVPKGEKDKIKAHAESNGESANGFINRAINETMKRDVITKNHIKKMKFVELTEDTCVRYLDESNEKEYLAIVNEHDEDEIYYFCEIIG